MAHSNPDYRIAPPKADQGCTMTAPAEPKAQISGNGRETLNFGEWHCLYDLPEPYQKDIRAKVLAMSPELRPPITFSAAGLPKLKVQFVRQGNFTVCLLWREGSVGLAPHALGVAKRNMRVSTRYYKGPERESVQVGQRAALGRAMDAWLRGKMAWTRPRTA